MAEVKLKSQSANLKTKSKISKVKKETETKSSKAKKVAVVESVVEARKKNKSSTVNSSTKVKAKNQSSTSSKSLKIDVLGEGGKVVEKIELPKEIFGVKVNKVLMAQAVRVYLANQRTGSASTKTRGEVRGSTRKIYRQKGTGRARHGAITAPIFVGGGITFGPKPRDFSLNLSKKMRKAALKSALTLKFENDEVYVINIEMKDYKKTKQAAKLLSDLSLLEKKGKNRKILFVFTKAKSDFEKMVRNIEGVALNRANQLTTYEVLNSRHLVFLKNSVDDLKTVLTSN